MKIGINMLVWTPFVTREHLPQLQMLKALGADGVEIPLMEGSVAHYAELGRVLDDVGLARTCVTVFPDAEHNPVSDDPRQRQGALDWMNWAVESAAAMKATVICGPIYQTLGMFSGTGPTETEKARAADVLRAVADPAQAAGVVLAVEPLNRFESYLLNTLDDAAKFVGRIGHPSVGLLYDTFHANMEEKDPIGALRRHGGAIRHFHVSANDRGTPGQDHIDWPATFAALRATGYDEWLTVEAFGRAMPTLAAATRVWRDLFGSSEQLARDSITFIREQWGRFSD